MLRLRWLVMLSHSCIFFGFRLAKILLVKSSKIDKQLLFPIGCPNCTLSTFPIGGDGGEGVVEKCVTKENCKSNLDLDLCIKTYVFIL